MVRICLYEPEIPQNTGTLLRLAACLDVGVDIIEPCGFIWNNKRLKRAGMDYIDSVDIKRHDSFDAFKSQKKGRLVLLTPHTDNTLPSFKFEKEDLLLLGRESDGVPESVANICEETVSIPMNSAMRSLNIALAGAIALSEALRQTGTYPED